MLLVLPSAILLSGCADSIRDTYNTVTVATGCHMLRDAETAECHRIAARQRDQGAATASTPDRHD